MNDDAEFNHTHKSPGSGAQWSLRRLTPLTAGDCDQGLICAFFTVQENNQPRKILIFQQHILFQCFFLFKVSLFTLPLAFSIAYVTKYISHKSDTYHHHPHQDSQHLEVHLQFKMKFLHKHITIMSRNQDLLRQTSLVAQLVKNPLVKNPPAMWEIWVWSLGWEDPLEKGKATHSSIPAWRIPWTV